MRSDDMISRVHIAIHKAAMKQNLIICGVVIAYEAVGIGCCVKLSRHCA